MQIILYVRSELANSDGIVPSFIEQQQPFFTHGMQKFTVKTQQTHTYQHC